MPLHNLDLDTLRTFVTTHDVGDFAWVRCGGGMKRFQEEFGTPLLRKHGPGPLADRGRTDRARFSNALKAMKIAAAACLPSTMAF